MTPEEAKAIVALFDMIERLEGEITSSVEYYHESDTVKAKTTQFVTIGAAGDPYRSGRETFLRIVRSFESLSGSELLKSRFLSCARELLDNSRTIPDECYGVYNQFFRSFAHKKKHRFCAAKIADLEMLVKYLNLARGNLFLYSAYVADADGFVDPSNLRCALKRITRGL